MSVDNLPKKPKPDSLQQEDVAGAGGPPYDGSMEARVKRLEEDVAAIKTDLAVVRSNYVTKADVQAVENRLIKWMIATTVGMVATTVSVGVGSVTVLTFLLNNPGPKAQPPSPPIVIAVPYPAPTNGSAPVVAPGHPQK
jgi:hypothetical protein